MDNFMESTFDDDFDASLDRFGDAIRELVVPAGAAAMARVIYDEAKQQTLKHKKSGLLHDAIYRVFSKSRSNASVATYHVSWNKTKAPHGHLLEWGTSRAPAYPFMRPAADRIPDAIEAGKKRMAERLAEITTFIPEK